MNTNETQAAQTLRGRCDTIRETLEKAYALTVRMVGPVPSDDGKMKEPTTALDVLDNELVVIQCLAEGVLDRAQAIINAIE